MSLTLITNPDKKYNETWEPERDFMNFPCPSRIVLCGSPNVGKSTIIINLILKAKPFYKRIFLMHPMLMIEEDDEDGDDVEVVKEYKHIDYEAIYEFPNPKFFNNGCKKQLLIIDDKELRTLPKEQKARLNKILSYASSHYNLSVVVACQDSFGQLPVCVLRFCNVIVIWRFNDLNYLRMLLLRCGVSGKKCQDAIINELKDYDKHDCIVCDYTENTPAKYRKNFYIPLNHI